MQLSFQLYPIDQIRGIHVDSLWPLMHANYDHVSKDNFLKDLFKKDYVGILRNEQNQIKGFTTFGVNPNGSGTEDYSIVFSGDTIICPSHWGTQEMIRGGMRAMGQIISSEPHKKWYWFLICKGHRTYMYLPLFFNLYYPAKDPQRNGCGYAEITDHSASCMFKEAWDQQKGIITFPQKLGQLKQDLAAPTWKKKKKPHVAYFLERNPNFEEGDELACLTELSPENMHIRLRNELITGMQQTVYAH